MFQEKQKKNVPKSRGKQLQIWKVGIPLVLMHTKHEFTNITKLIIIWNIIRNQTQIVTQINSYYYNQHKLQGPHIHSAEYPKSPLSSWFPPIFHIVLNPARLWDDPILTRSSNIFHYLLPLCAGKDIISSTNFVVPFYTYLYIFIWLKIQFVNSI